MPHANLTDPLHTASTLLSAMASPRRQSLLAEVSRRTESGEETSFSALGAALNWTVREIGKESSHLVDVGLLRSQNGNLVCDLSVLRASVAELDAMAPLAGAIAANAGARRFFAHGKLTTMPEDRADKVEICEVVVQLLPLGTELTEAEVNERLRTVYDDVAGLRRLLFDAKFVDREASQGYRRLR